MVVGVTIEGNELGYRGSYSELCTIIWRPGACGYRGSVGIRGS